MSHTVNKSKLVPRPARQPVPERRAQRSLEVFEKAIKAFGRKDFERAAELFDSLLDEAEAPQELLERARCYRGLCHKPRPTEPRGFEELLNFGVMQHNRGDFAAAVKYLSQALALRPRDEGALYCLAAAHARAGEAHGALAALRAAIEANPASRSQARHDEDFELLRHQGEFRALLGRRTRGTIEARAGAGAAPARTP